MADTVFLTRPEGENEALGAMLRGFDVRIHPLLKLSGLSESPDLKTLVLDLDHFDLLIFVSKSAVRFGMPLLDRYWVAWPIGLAWLAVGAGTAAALREYGVQVAYPEKAGSEGLLNLPELAAVAGKKALIVRGRGGRELLAETLKARGASVSYLEAYERVTLLPTLVDVPKGAMVVATSGEILAAAAKTLGEKLAEVSVIVPSERIAEQAVALGAGYVENAAGASDQALYDAILRCGLNT